MEPIASQLLHQLLVRGPLSRSQISKLTGLNPATITRLSQRLLDGGFIREGREMIGDGGPGRRAIELDLRTDFHFVVGLAVNAYQQSVVLADLKGRVVARASVPRERKRDPDRTLMMLAEAARGLLAEKGLTAKSLLGTGIVCAGVVDSHAQVVLNSPDIGWFQTPVARPLEDALGAPVFLETMQNGLNLTECSFGRAVGARNALLISIALGVGGSLIVDGRLIRGAESAASGIGHMPIAEADEPCNCGRRGCLTTLASGYAVLRSLGLVNPYAHMQEHEPSYATLLTSTLDAAQAGDPEINAAFGKAGEALGSALKGVIAAVPPDVIILSGPVSGAKSYRDGVARQLAASDRDPYPWPGTLLVSDTELPAAAARLALERFVFRSYAHVPPARSRENQQLSEVSEASFKGELHQ